MEDRPLPVMETYMNGLKEGKEKVTVSLFEAVWTTGGACREHSWAVWFAEMPHPDVWLYRLNKI